MGTKHPSEPDVVVTLINYRLLVVSVLQHASTVDFVTVVIIYRPLGHFTFPLQEHLRPYTLHPKEVQNVPRRATNSFVRPETSAGTGRNQGVRGGFVV